MEARSLSPSSCTADIVAKDDTIWQSVDEVVVLPEEALTQLCERTKCQITQENGQRRYGPPPDWTGTIPSRGCEVFVGKIPRDCFENELIPIFEKIGRIYMFRLMMDFNGYNRGYGFCIYTNSKDCRRAVHELDNYEIREGKMLGVCLSVDNCRLFVGGIPKTKTKSEIMTEMMKVSEDVKNVIVYPSAADKTKNRGFAFVEYENHKAAALARRKLMPGKIQLWGQHIAVDWAEPEREVDKDIMSKVKILYVRNLMLSTTEEHLRNRFNQAAGCDCVERVKKILDYAFIHFREREHALLAMHHMSDAEIDGSHIEVSLAKPVDKSENATSSRSDSKNALNTNPAFAFATLDPITMTYYTHMATGALSSDQLSPGLLQTTPTVNLSMINQNGSPMRNVFRGRGYRNAAGSRSAGQRYTPTIPGYVRDKKYNVENSQMYMGQPQCHEAHLFNGFNSPLESGMNGSLASAAAQQQPSYFPKVTLPNFNGLQCIFTPEEGHALSPDSSIMQLGLLPTNLNTAPNSHFSTVGLSGNSFGELPIMHTSNLPNITMTPFFLDPATMFLNNAILNSTFALTGAVNPDCYRPY